NRSHRGNVSPGHAGHGEPAVRGPTGQVPPRERQQVAAGERSRVRCRVTGSRGRQHRAKHPHRADCGVHDARRPEELRAQLARHLRAAWDQSAQARRGGGLRDNHRRVAEQIGRRQQSGAEVKRRIGKECARDRTRVTPTLEPFDLRQLNDVIFCQWWSRSLGAAEDLLERRIHLRK
ncbi:hypothetical protein T492DRAFT_897611, partial [Pavlovales sp. CCMP2436]